MGKGKGDSGSFNVLGLQKIWLEKEEFSFSVIEYLRYKIHDPRLVFRTIVGLARYTLIME